MATNTSTALANPDEPFKDVLEILKPYPAEKYHRLVPTALQQRSPLYAPALQVVYVDPEDQRDVYKTPGSRDGTLCLHTQALERIANAIGIDFGQTKFETHEKLWVTAHVPFEVVDALGQRRRGSASKTIDLRDGSIQAGLLGGGLQAARQFIYERAEAGARSRVTKKWTGMPTSFAPEELRKPFVALRWTLDVNQPDVRKALIEAGTRASSSVFGGEGAPIAIEAGDDDDVIEGEARETTVDDGPEIPDAPAPKVDAAAVIAAFQQRAKARPETQKASDELLGSLAIAIADVYSIDRKDKDAISAARKGVASAIFGAKSVRDLTSAQALTVIDASKSPEGQRDLAAIADIIGIKQQTLSAAAAAL